MGKFYCGDALCKTAATVPAGASPPWPICCSACGAALYPTDVLDRLPPSVFEPKRAELMTERAGRRVAVMSREIDGPRLPSASAPRSNNAPEPADAADRILAMVDLGPAAPDAAPSPRAASLPARPPAHPARSFVVPALLAAVIVAAVLAALLTR
jgi:hypothetical protein